VNSGGLEAATPGSLAGYSTLGTINVADGATLAVQFGGTGQFTSANVDTLRTDATFADGAGVATLGLDVTGTNSATYSSVITDSTGTNPNGALAVEKLGSGTLTLSGANSYSGDLTIAAGTFIAGAGTSGNNGPAGNVNSPIQLGTATSTSASLEAGTFAVPNPINVGTAGALTLGNDGGSDDAYFSGAITLNGNGLTIATTGTSTSSRVIASGSITGVGNLVLNNSSAGGTIWLGFPPPSDVHAGPPQSPNDINNTGTITNNGTSTGLTTISNTIKTNVTGVYENTSSLTASPLVLAGSNTFTSGLYIHGGTVDAAQVSQALGAGAVTLGNTSGSVPAALLISTSFLQFSNPINLAANASLSGVGSLTIGTTQAVTIGRPTDATATFSGNVTGNNNLTISLGGNGTLIFTGTFNISGTIINNGTGIGTTIINSNIPSSVTGITENGTSNLILSGTNANTGSDTITAGELSVGADANLGSGNSIVFNGGTLQITGTSLTTAASNMIGSHPYSINSGTTAGFDINDPNNTFTISDALTQGAGGLTKLGAGTLVLTKANTYTGVTLIGGGTLQLGNGGTTGSLSPSSTIVDNSAGNFGVLTNLGTLAIDRSNTVTQGTDFSGSGIGTFQLTGNTRSTGSTTQKTTISGLASTVLLAPGMVVSGPGIPAGDEISAITSATSFRLITAATATATGVLLTFTETGGLANSGSGTTILTAANTYSGPTSVYNGVLQVGNGGATGSLGTGPVTIGSGNLVFDLSSTVTVPNVIQNLTGGNPGGSAPIVNGANPGHDMVQMDPSTGLEVIDSSINIHDYANAGQLYQYHWGATGSDRPGEIPVVAPFNPIAVQAIGLDTSPSNTVTGSGALFYLTTNESTQNTSPTAATIPVTYTAGSNTVALTSGTIAGDGISIGQVVEGAGIVTVPADVNGNGGPGSPTSPTGTFITSVDTVHNTFTLNIAPTASGTSLLLPALANLQASGIGGVQIVSGGGNPATEPGAVPYTQADVGKILTVAQGQGTFSIGHGNSLTPNPENYANPNVTPAQLIITQVNGGSGSGPITGVALFTPGTYQPYSPVETGDQTLLDPIFTGSVSGTTLTVESFTSGTDAPYNYGFDLAVGQTVFDSSGNSLGQITALGTGTGGIGTYTLNASASVASESMTAQTTTSFTGSITNNVLSVDAGSLSGSPLVVGDTISGAGIPIGTAIEMQNGDGTYQLATLDGRLLTITDESLTGQLNQTLTTASGAQLPIESNMLSPALTQPTTIDNSDQNGQPSGYGSGFGDELMTTYEMTSAHELYAPLTGDTTAGSNVIANVTDNSPAGTPFAVGFAVDGPGIPAGAIITGVSGTSITLSQDATVTATGSSFDSWDEWSSAIDPNTIAAAGTGYASGETVVALGGVTAAAGAPLLGTVTTDASGAVTGFVASDATNNGFQGDAADSANWYSVLPTVPCPVTGGSGTGNPLFNLTMNDVLSTTGPTGIAIATVVSGHGGSGYKVGDVLTLSAPAGITPVGTAATLTVTAVDGSGAIKAVNVKTAGSYSKWNPATLFYVAPLPGGSSGSGCILSWQALQTSIPDNASSSLSPDAGIANGGGYAVGDVLAVTGGSWKDSMGRTVTWTTAPILQVTHYSYSSSGPSFTYIIINTPVPSIPGEFPPSSVTFNVFPLGYTPSTTVIGPVTYYGAGVNGGVGEFTAGATVNFGPQSFGGTPGAVIQEGAGTTILTGTNTYPGATQVTGGTLQVNSTIAASSGVSVSSGATLDGIGGTVSGVNVAGAIQAGAGTTTGTLNLAGLSFSGAGSSYTVDLDSATPGTGFDQVTSSGAVSLNGATLTVNVGAGFNPPLGTKLDILVNTSGSAPGTFAGLPEGATITASNGARFTISYTGGAGHDVVLTYTAAGASSFLITAPSTTTAGSNFIFTVQALDASNNPTAAFNGTITFSTTDPQGVVPAPISLANGFGFYLGDLKTVSGGPWTISVTGAAGTISGTSAAITVTPGTPAKLGFGTQPVNTPTGVTLPAVTVQILDSFGNVVTSDNSDAVTVGIASGPPGAPGFLAGSTTTATVHNGVATFSNLTLVKPGTYTLSEVVPATLIGPNSTSFTVAPLQVTSVDPDDGFTLTFNAPFLVNSMTPALYGSGFGASAPVPSVTLTQIEDASGNPITPVQVEGSVVLNTSTNSLTFLATNTASQVNNGTPILPDGTYRIDVLSSGATGFQAKNSGGGFLDGLGSGAAGSGDYTTTFTVTAGGAHADILWLPDTADGPLQPLEAPGANQAGGGYPLYINADDATGVTDVQVTMSYNPALLTVSSTSASINGGTFTVTASAGSAVLHWHGPALVATAGTPLAVGFLTATVPNGTAANPIYRSKDLLHLSSPSINGGTVPVTTSDALHLVAYVGDANGDGTYSSADAVLTTRVALQTDSGFTAYPLVDPVIVADTDGSGFIPADAALQENEAGVGFTTANLANPPVPAGAVVTPISNSVDPALGLPNTLTVSPGGVVSVPVNLDDAHPAGSTGLVEAHLALTYNPGLFTVSAADVHLGSLLAGGGWSLTPTIDPATGQIAIALSSSTPIASAVGGSLVTIDFHLAEGVRGEGSGVSGHNSYLTPDPWPLAPIRLVASVNINGQMTATELEDAQGTFVLTPTPASGFDSRIDGLVAAPAIATISAISPTASEQPANNVAVTQVVEAVPTEVSETLGAVPVATVATSSEEESSASADSAPVHVDPATAHASAALVSAATSSQVNLNVSPLTGMVAQVMSVVTAGVPSAAAAGHVADQFFQALARGMVNDGGTINPLLLPTTPADSFDNLNGDEMGSVQTPLTTSAGQQSPARRRLVVDDTALSQQQPDQATLDQAFAQTAEDADLVGFDE
jgi:autotransporter-associated beta strand protein